MGRIRRSFENQCGYGEVEIYVDGYKKFFQVAAVPVVFKACAKFAWTAGAMLYKGISKIFASPKSNKGGSKSDAKKLKEASDKLMEKMKREKKRNENAVMWTVQDVTWMLGDAAMHLG